MKWNFDGKIVPQWGDGHTWLCGDILVTMVTNTNAHSTISIFVDSGSITSTIIMIISIVVAVAIV